MTGHRVAVSVLRHRWLVGGVFLVDMLHAVVLHLDQAVRPW